VDELRLGGKLSLQSCAALGVEKRDEKRMEGGLVKHSAVGCSG
jgi:hypothetical protein